MLVVALFLLIVVKVISSTNFDGFSVEKCLRPNSHYTHYTAVNLKSHIAV